MDLCHLKNAEPEPQFQKYQGRVVLRGDIVKGDSGAYAVFTEQGSSASQMTTAKVMDVIARLPDCDEEAADAVSAYTLVKTGGCSQIAQNSKVTECPYIMDTPSTTQMVQYRGQTLKIQWFHSIENVYGHPLAGLLWERQFEEVLLELGWEKVANW